MTGNQEMYDWLSYLFIQLTNNKLCFIIITTFILKVRDSLFCVKIQIIPIATDYRQSKRCSYIILIPNNNMYYNKSRRFICMKRHVFSLRKIRLTFQAFSPLLPQHHADWNYLGSYLIFFFLVVKTSTIVRSPANSWLFKIFAKVSLFHRFLGLPSVNRMTGQRRLTVVA